MNRIDLEGMNAVVTGGARGIGRAIGERLRSSGASVAVWDSDCAAMTEARGDRPGDGPAGWIEVDVTNPAAVDAAHGETLRTVARIDILVNNAGISGPNAPAYSAAKAGVIALTKTLGKELAGTGIAVNCVTSAAVETGIFAQMSQAHIDYMRAKIPLARFGRPDETAALAAWLCSRECPFSTGAIFDLSGGRATY